MADAIERRVLITGAGSGIGKSIAERLAQAGYDVIGTVRDPARAEEFTAQAQSAGLRQRYVALDLTLARQVEEVAAALAAQGGVDAVVHNAGAGVFGSIEEVGAEQAAWQLAVGVLGPLALTRALLPSLRCRRGRVIFVGSLAGRLALPFQGHYSAAKAALASLSDALRMELAPFGVKVTCVEPGDFATGFTDARHFVRPPGSPYAQRLESCLAAVDRQERHGASSEWVARVVEKLLASPRPPARRPVGRWARTICLLARCLPDSIREAMMRRQYRI